MPGKTETPSVEVSRPGDGIVPTWLPRPDPLPPLAATARGEAARVLARRLLGRLESLPQLAGVAGGDLLVITPLTGEADRLPWVEGIVYLGRDPLAPSLLLPTTLAPSVSLSLLEPALLRRFDTLPVPLVVLPMWDCVLSLADAHAIDADQLRQWLEVSPA